MGITEFSDHKTVTDYIKEVETKANSAQADIGDIDDLETVADTLVGAINEVNTKAIAAAELPAVTSTDNGKVLTVSEGAWDKATPVSNVFTATFTVTNAEQSQSSGVTCDKTLSQIVEAYDSGKCVRAVIKDTSGSGYNFIVPLSFTINNEQYAIFTGCIKYVAVAERIDIAIVEMVGIGINYEFKEISCA